MASCDCPICGSEMHIAHHYTERPEGEIVFGQAGSTYSRFLWQCEQCRHFISVSEIDPDTLYKDNYVDSTYSGLEGIIKTFSRIINLPPERSDNYRRVNRIVAHYNEMCPAVSNDRRSVLDVGSGLCVFLHRMRQLGWQGTALDMDPRQIEHAVQNVGVKGILGSFMDYSFAEKFDLVAFNRVLEHVSNPREMLVRARDVVADSGLIYVEVPDGEMAFLDSPAREEFFIDHLHVFSMSSLLKMVEQSGLLPLIVHRLRDPSGKYTLYAMARTAGGEQM